MSAVSVYCFTVGTGEKLLLYEYYNTLDAC